MRCTYKAFLRVQSPNRTWVLLEWIEGILTSYCILQLAIITMGSRKVRSARSHLYPVILCILYLKCNLIRCSTVPTGFCVLWCHHSVHSAQALINSCLSNMSTAKRSNLPTNLTVFRVVFRKKAQQAPQIASYISKNSHSKSKHFWP